MSSPVDIDWVPKPPDGVRVGRTPTSIVVEWAGIGKLMVSPSGDDATFQPDADVDGAWLEKFRATTLLACRRYLTGALTLHGAAVQMPWGALALVGDRGAGKSTTAMALVDAGYGAFLADDMVPVDWDDETPIVAPVDDSFWLLGEARAWFGLDGASSEKRPQAPRARATQTERLRAIVHLVFDESAGEVHLRPLHGQETFLVLSHAHSCFATGEPDEPIRNLVTRARLASSVLVVQLTRPRSMNGLTKAMELLARGPEIDG